MTVGKIALGVFLGNLAFAILASVVAAFVWQNAQQSARGQQAEQDYQVLRQHQRQAP